MCVVVCVYSHKMLKTKTTLVARQHRQHGKRTKLRPVQVMPAPLRIRSKAIRIQLTHVRCPLIRWKIWNRVQIIHFSTVTKQNHLTTRIERLPPPIRRKRMTTWPAAWVAAVAKSYCCKPITMPMVIRKLKRNQCPASNRTDPSKSWGIFFFFIFFCL